MAVCTGGKWTLKIVVGDRLDPQTGETSATHPSFLQSPVPISLSQHALIGLA